MDRCTIEKAAMDYAGTNVWWPGETSYECDCLAMTKSFADAFTAGAEWQAKQSPWIKVSERLPEEDGYYLITDGMNLAVAYFFKDWGKFAKYREYPHPLYDDGVVKLYMSIPPISFDWITGLDKYEPNKED